MFVICKRENVRVNFQFHGLQKNQHFEHNKVRFFFNFKFRNKWFFFSYFKELTQIINKKEINISPLNLLSKSNNTQIICPDATSKILQLIY